MSTQALRTEKVLMIVKTYPTPSSAYGELVCTAGISLDTKTWVRIYPYPFRQASKDEQFDKYDIIELPLERETRDPRPDSYRLYDIGSVKKIDHLAVFDKYWSNRMTYIRETAAPSVEELMRGMLSEDKTVWGSSILPVPVQAQSAKLSSEFRGNTWEKKDLEKLRKIINKEQPTLFGKEEANSYFQILKRVPYLFRLTFQDLMGVEYTFPILDWEIAQLYFKVRQKTGSEKDAIEKVRFKVENQIFASKREVFLILGNIHHRFKRRESLAVDGFIYPERQLQFSLF